MFGRHSQPGENQDPAPTWLEKAAVIILLIVTVVIGAILAMF